MKPVTLTVAEYRGRDPGSKTVRLPLEATQALGIEPGGVAVFYAPNGRRAAAHVWLLEPGDEKVARMDRFLRESLGVHPGDTVKVEPAWGVSTATRVTLAPLRRNQPLAKERITTWLRDKPVALGELIVPPRAPLSRVIVVDVEPHGDTVLVGPKTRIEFSEDPVATRIWATGTLERTPRKLCRGDQEGDTLILGVEPPPCGWLWPGTSVTRVDREYILRLMARNGLLEEAVRGLEEGALNDTPLTALRALLALLLLEELLRER